MTNNPALDGIRAVAVLLVIFSHAHAGPSVLRSGYLGVDIFFVLSGFLITRLLLNELQQTGTLDIRRFYVNRFARLTPPLLLLLVLYLAIAHQLWPDYRAHVRDALIAGGYLSDYGVALWGVPKMLRHTWSLAAEEHFYLFWPLVLLLLKPCKPRTILLILLGVYLLASCWRVYCAETQSWRLMYYRFDTRFSGLIIGSIVAILLSQKWQLSLKSREIAVMTVMLLITLFTLGPDMGWKHKPTIQYGVIVFELATALVIILAMRQTVYVKWLSWEPMVYLGRLSYGIYLFHYPIMIYLREYYGGVNALWAGFGGSLVLAAFSYHTIEARVRLWKEKNRTAHDGLLVGKSTAKLIGRTV
jgi:peptidoglycan/LPS O-acetylase OafA/YrhL